jgi:hypothetical protein
VKQTRRGATADDCFQLRQIADAGHRNGDASIVPIAGAGRALRHELSR